MSVGLEVGNQDIEYSASCAVVDNVQKPRRTVPYQPEECLFQAYGRRAVLFLATANKEARRHYTGLVRAEIDSQCANGVLEGRTEHSISVTPARRKLWVLEDV